MTEGYNDQKSACLHLVICWLEETLNEIWLLGTQQMQGLYETLRTIHVNPFWFKTGGNIDLRINDEDKMTGG